MHHSFTTQWWPEQRRWRAGRAVRQSPPCRAYIGSYTQGPIQGGGFLEVWTPPLLHTHIHFRRTPKLHKGLVINYGEGGATKWENRGSETFCAPPQDRVKLFAPPLLKSGNFSRPPYNMATTPSYRVKTTPKLFVPPLQHGLNFFRPPFS